MYIRPLIDSGDQSTQARSVLQRSSEQPSEPKDNNQIGNDTELFIRRAFDESPKQGCELLFRRYHKALCSHAVRFVYSKSVLGN